MLLRHKGINLIYQGVLTGGLIIGWNRSYPFIIDTLNALAVLDNHAFHWGASEFIESDVLRLSILFYMTAWWQLYIGAFFQEWDILRFEYLEIGACLGRWIKDSIVWLFFPLIFGLTMYFLLVYCTSVPWYVKAPVAFLYWLWKWIQGWSFPGRKIQEVHSLKRSRQHSQ